MKTCVQSLLKCELHAFATSDRYFPDGIDINFENVGGEMLEAALANMNTYGRVAVCGVFSEYTAGRRAVPDLMEVIYKRITIRGFFGWDFLTRFDQFVRIIGDWIRQGKIQAIEGISDGLENVPSAFTALFHGKKYWQEARQADIKQRGTGTTY